MRNPIARAMLLLTLVPVLGVAGSSRRAAGQEPDLPKYLRDRGTGLPTSMFATYIRRGQLLVYPFFEYYRDNDYEYKPAELGYGLDQDFRGRYRASEGLIFIGYGLTDWLALELEAAVISASLEKSPNDPSLTPARIEESGLGDVEGQLRWRWGRETSRRPEIFGYFEAVSPRRNKRLIGTPDWEFKAGTGVIKGFSFGTIIGRIAVEYPLEERSLALGEYAVEYVRRLSPAWRIYLGVEGTEDEVELITEAQWHVTDGLFFKFNNGFGVTSKATGWAPEIGVMFSFPLRSVP